MIISRTPFRICLAGQYTDNKEFSTLFGGLVIDVAIDKYIYVTANRKFDDLIRVSYNKTEVVKDVNEIHHEAVKEALKFTKILEKAEITLVADIPGRNTGIGGAGSSCVGILNALYALKSIYKSPDSLAKSASFIGHNLQEDPEKLHDKYIAAYGGLQLLRFNKDGGIVADQFSIAPETRKKLEKNLLLFYTKIVPEEDLNVTLNLNQDLLQESKRLVLQMKLCLENADLDEFGRLLTKSWELERQISFQNVSTQIFEWYKSALDSGALGGKILGPTGSYLLFYVPENKQKKVYETLSELRRITFSFEKVGSTIIYVDVESNLIRKEVSLSTEPIKINEKILSHALERAQSQHKKVLAITLATKPCFYKLWSLVEEAEKRDIPYFIMHSGQHYDPVVGGGLKEFNFESNLGVDLAIRGDLSQKSAELYLKSKELYNYVKLKFPKAEIVPYVNGDTLTAGILPAAWMFASNRKVIHGEAGLRSMSPKSFFGFKDISPEKFVEDQFYGEWALLRNEPYPEQYDTFIASAGSQFFFSPVTLNSEHLYKEGYSRNSIWTVGNTVVDGIQLKKKERSGTSVFETYPELEKGDWLRVDLHRRENLEEKRIKSLVGAIIKLVESGQKVCFVELNAARQALDEFKLRDKLISLSERYPNFIYTPLWQEYGQVIEFLESDHCRSILTDSGSLQEEMNELGKFCMTYRFSTDRPETIFGAKSNLLIPPLNANLVFDKVRSICENDSLIKSAKICPKLYGLNVAKKIIKIVDEQVLDQNINQFRSSDQELGINLE